MFRLVSGHEEHHLHHHGLVDDQQDVQVVGDRQYGLIAVLKILPWAH